MKILISIDGVLRDTISKFDYHYKDYFLNSDVEKSSLMELPPITIDKDGNIIPIKDEDITEAIIETDSFEYGIEDIVNNDNLRKYYKFQSDKEFENFLYIDFAIEIFGQTPLSNVNVFFNLNQIIYNHPEHEFVLVGLDEFGKAKPATFFLLSRHGYLGNNVTFIKKTDIKKTWETTDIWVTDNQNIINECPEGKNAVLYHTKFNEFIEYDNKITNIKQLEKLC